MMTRTLRGTATDAIAFGQHVLVRGYYVSPAEPSVANGIARGLPAWTRQRAYAKGDFVMADAIEGLGERDVHQLARLPIMEPIRLNLPAGKLSESEYQERLDLQFKEAGIERR
jgi:hypothetical protein